jgi:hypothetical protein
MAGGASANGIAESRRLSLTQVQPECRCDRSRHELRIGQRGEIDEEHRGSAKDRTVSSRPTIRVSRGGSFLTRSVAVIPVIKAVGAAAERYRLVGLLEQPLGRKQAERAKRKHVFGLSVAPIIHRRRPRLTRTVGSRPCGKNQTTLRFWSPWPVPSWRHLS